MKYHQYLIVSNSILSILQYLIDFQLPRLLQQANRKRPLAFLLDVVAGGTGLFGAERSADGNARQWSLTLGFRSRITQSQFILQTASAVKQRKLQPYRSVVAICLVRANACAFITSRVIPGHHGSPKPRIPGAYPHSNRAFRECTRIPEIIVCVTRVAALTCCNFGAT